MSNKPKFDPSQPFEAADKPKFDPNQPFESADESQVSAAPEIGTAEALGRGFLDPTTLGFYKSLEAGIKTAGSAPKGSSLEELYNTYKEHLGKSKQREEEAFKQHPIAYGTGFAGSLLVNPVGEALGGVEALNAAKNAPAIEKVVGGALTGAALGGAYTAGSSGQTLAEQNPNDIAKGAVGGGLFGGALSSLGVGAGKLANAAAEKEIPLISDMARKYVLGTEGTSLYNAQKLTQSVADNATKLGEEGIGAQAKAVSDEMGKVLNAAKESGKEVDLNSVMDQVGKLKEQIQTIENPNVKAELQDLVTYMEDSVLGPLEKKKITTLEKTGEKTIQPEVQGTEQQLNGKLEQLNRDAELSGKPERYQLERKTSGGKEYLNIRVTNPGEESAGLDVSNQIEQIKEPTPKQIKQIAEVHGVDDEQAHQIAREMNEKAAEDRLAAKLAKKGFGANLVGENPQQNIIKGEGQFENMIAGQTINQTPIEPQQPEFLSNNWLENVPGQVQQVQSIYEPVETTIQQRARENPLLQPEEAKTLESNLGQRIYGEQAFKTPEGRQAAQKLDQAVTGQVNAGVPAYEPLRKQDALFRQAMDDMGLGVGKPSDLYTRDAQGNQVFDPRVASKLENLFRRSTNDPHAKQMLDMAFEKLEAAGYQGLNELKENLFKSLKNEELGTGLPNLKSAVSPIGGKIFKALKAISIAPNIAGLAQDSVGKALPVAFARSSASQALGGVTEDFLGNQIKSKAKESPEEFSRRLYSSSPEDLKHIANALKTTPFASIGETLQKALEANDQPKINSANFLISTNPKIREALKEPGTAR